MMDRPLCRELELLVVSQIMLTELLLALLTRQHLLPTTLDRNNYRRKHRRLRSARWFNQLCHKWRMLGQRRIRVSLLLKFLCST